MCVSHPVQHVARVPCIKHDCQRLRSAYGSRASATRRPARHPRACVLRVPAAVREHKRTAPVPSVHPGGVRGPGCSLCQQRQRLRSTFRSVRDIAQPRVRPAAAVAPGHRPITLHAQRLPRVAISFVSEAAVAAAALSTVVNSSTSTQSSHAYQARHDIPQQEDRRTRRLSRNREAAKRNRIKKKSWLDGLIKSNAEVESKNVQLKERMCILDAELRELRQMMADAGHPDIAVPLFEF
ncbi:hypothetical protein BC831DRAFT_163947 [Entophlyctis helioformis]|nr:hypothetical protein BC831DRAFT_163947 [Entophlyctis helioformis]